MEDWKIGKMKDKLMLQKLLLHFSSTHYSNIPLFQYVPNGN